MRVHTAENPGSAAEIEEFADLKVGKGRHESCSKCGSVFVKVPREIFVKHGQRNKPILSSIDWVYGDIERRFMETDYFAQRMILTPMNGTAQEINEEVIHQLPGDIQKCLSNDAVQEQEDTQHKIYPVEVLNTLYISGMPTHKWA
jgi:hypothetical protein